MGHHHVIKGGIKIPRRIRLLSGVFFPLPLTFFFFLNKCIYFVFNKFRAEQNFLEGEEGKAEAKGAVLWSRVDDVSHFPHLLIKILSGEANSSLK